MGAHTKQLWWPASSQFTLNVTGRCCFNTCVVYFCFWQPPWDHWPQLNEGRYSELVIEGGTMKLWC